MSQVYTGAFTVVLPVIQGTVTDTNGLPVAGALLQPSGGLPAATTDTNGNYVLSVLFGNDVTVAPSLDSLGFVPGSRSYTNVTASISNQTYLVVPTIVPTLATRLQTTNIALSWFGIPGVAYQCLASTNLADWFPYGDPLLGTNGPVVILPPIHSAPSMFFRVRASN